MRENALKGAWRRREVTIQMKFTERRSDGAMQSAAVCESERLVD